jgi:hypothetical protein
MPHPASAISAGKRDGAGSSTDTGESRERSIGGDAAKAAVSRESRLPATGTMMSPRSSLNGSAAAPAPRIFIRSLVGSPQPHSRAAGRPQPHLCPYSVKT